MALVDLLPPTDGFEFIMVAQDVRGTWVSEQHVTTPGHAAEAAESWLRSNPSHSCMMLMWQDGAGWLAHGPEMYGPNYHEAMIAAGLLPRGWDVVEPGPEQDMRAAIPGTYVYVSIPNCVPVEFMTHATWDGAVQHYIAQGFALHDVMPDRFGRWRMNHPNDVPVFIRRSKLGA
jgi:hypothetical protein